MKVNTEEELGWRTWRWPAIVVLLLAGHVVLMLGALSLSTALIPAATVAPDGYDEALAWDERQAARADSEQLGWQLMITPTRQVDIRGDRLLEFSLVDSQDAPIADADVRVTMYHYGRPSERLELDVPPKSDGSGYAAKVQASREGLWRVETIIHRGAERFLAESDLWLGRSEQEGSTR